MATGIGILDLTFQAGADLSSKIYFLVKKGADTNEVDLCGDGDPILGVLQNDPTEDHAAIVRVLGVSPVVCGVGDLAEGAIFSADSEGTAQTADTGDYVGGVCLSSGTDDGRLATVLIQTGGMKSA